MLDFAGGVRWAKVVLLAQNLPVTIPIIRQPEQHKLLGARLLRFIEHQQDMFDSSGLIENNADRLLA